MTNPIEVVQLALDNGRFDNGSVEQAAQVVVALTTAGLLTDRYAEWALRVVPHAGRSHVVYVGGEDDARTRAARLLAHGDWAEVIVLRRTAFEPTPWEVVDA